MIFYQIVYVCGRSDGAAGKKSLTPYGPLFFVVYLHILTHSHFKLSSICSNRTTHVDNSLEYHDFLYDN